MHPPVTEKAELSKGKRIGTSSIIKGSLLSLPRSSGFINIKGQSYIRFVVSPWSLYHLMLFTTIGGPNGRDRLLGLL